MKCCSQKQSTTATEPEYLLWFCWAFFIHILMAFMKCLNVYIVRGGVSSLYHVGYVNITIYACANRTFFRMNKKDILMYARFAYKTVIFLRSFPRENYFFLQLTRLLLQTDFAASKFKRTKENGIDCSPWNSIQWRIWHLYQHKWQFRTDSKRGKDI